MRPRHAIRHRQRLRTAVRVCAHRVAEQPLACAKAALDQAALTDRLDRHHRRSLVRDRHVARTQRCGRRRGQRAFVASPARAVCRRDAHLQRLQIRRVMAVEVSGSGSRQHDLPVAQRKIRRVRPRHVIRHRQRLRAAVRVCAHRVAEQPLACAKAALDQAGLTDRLDRHHGRSFGRDRPTAGTDRRRGKRDVGRRQRLTIR